MSMKNITAVMESKILDQWRASWSVHRILADLKFSHGEINVDTITIYNLVDRAKKRGDIRATKRKKNATIVRSS